jgi:two-component system, NtrC family, response regulator AtoC
MQNNISILLVDDDTDFRESMTSELARRGFKISCAESGSKAKEFLAQNDVDVAILDIRMPKIDGIELLKQVKHQNPETEVIMLTGYGTMENALSAMRAGACDFLIKPCRLSQVEVAIANAYEKKTLKTQNKLLKNAINRKERYSDLVGKSKKINEVLTVIDKVAPMDSTVLILGESGVGKELVAKCIHQNSSRSSEPFIIMDCCSLNENLLQSELFGHEKGAYTGASGLKHGLFEVADKGTILIDEIGEISPAIQTGLLRVLETGSFRRVGGVKDINVDVRVLAATNRDLLKAIEDGTFREDLFYRLNVIAITVPPLRERVDDIPSLVEHALQSSRIPIARRKKMSDNAIEILKQYKWPGNVRELFNIIERAIVLSDNEIIDDKDFPLLSKSGTNYFENLDKKLSLAEMESDYINWILRKNNGNRKLAAEILKIDPKTLYRKLKD